MASSLFISDLHLSEERPGANETFFSFIEEKASKADSLYILGDFFEYWAGDDDLAEPFHSVIAGFLRGLSESGVELYVMHGNRDFLVGRQFCAETGAVLLEDPTARVANPPSARRGLPGLAPSRALGGLATRVHVPVTRGSARDQPRLAPGKHRCHRE